MVSEHVEAGHHTAGCGSGGPVTSAIHQVNLDWTRDPPPANMTVFQNFIRCSDWDKSPLGPMRTWSRELRQMVRLMMADTTPCILYWGDKYTIIYNEAYVPLVGAKHPGMLGMNAPDIFPDFWPHFDKVITDQRSTGETAAGEAYMLLMERHGFLEETFFDWKLIPVIGDDGKVKGSYGTSSDLTREVITSRRTTCLRHLTQRISKPTNLEGLWQAALAGLGDDEKDIPFALLYSVDKQTSLVAPPSMSNYTCRLRGSIGVSTEHVVAREYMDAQHDLDGFAPTVLKALETQKFLTVEASDPNLRGLLDGIGWKGFGLPSKQFVIVPLEADDEIAAFFILGLNPYRKYNKRYHDFLALIAEVVGPQISKMKLSEEVRRRAEIARKATLNFEKSETRFTRFADRSVVGLAVAGPDRSIIYANEAWYTIAGIDPNTKDHAGWIDSVYEEDIPLVTEWWTRVLSEKKGGQFQYRSKAPFRQGNMQSAQRTAICAAYADLNEAGEIDSIMGLVIDISELKWIEDQLRLRTKELEESEGKYRNYAEHCPLGIVRTDGKGYVQYGNDAWHAYYGLVRGTLTDPQPWLPYIHENYVEAWKECFDTFQKDPGPRAMELKLKDKVYTMNDGDDLIENGMYILITGFSEFKEDGTVDYIDFWVTDISPQKMAAKVLADKMNEAIQLKTHQERFIDMISHEIRNPLSAVLHCGEEIVEAMKGSLGQIETLPAATAGSPNSARVALRRQIQNALEAANTIMYCVQHQKQIVDDVLTLSKLDADLLVVSPVPIQPMALVRSSLKIFEPELKMTDIILSIIEDESLVNSNMEWILLDPNRFLQIVINLVTNAIKFTRTSAMRKIVIAVSALHEPPSGEVLGVEYVPRRYSPANPCSATGDILDEFKVLETVYLSFSVTDTGKGLTSAEKALLFNRFAQASPKTHIEYGGSGLGLFISRQITEMLGGEIGMSSTSGGSIFAFYVKAMKTLPPRRPSVSIEPILQMTRTLSLSSTASPLVVPPDEKSGATIGLTLIPPGPDPKTPPTQRHILVIEDNLVNQKVLCKLLRNRSFIVEAANHGQEALAAIAKLGATTERCSFDIILCDIEMPVMNGIEFAKEVRALESIGELISEHVPIIGVTANVRGQQVNAAIEAGMDGVTTKPYRIDELIGHIDRVCYMASGRNRESEESNTLG